MARVLRGLKLLLDSPARQLNRVFPVSLSRLLRRKSLFCFGLGGGGSLLLLYRFAFPSPGHDPIIANENPDSVYRGAWEPVQEELRS